MTREIFFLKNHTQNVMEKLVLDPFLNNQNWVCLWINTLKLYRVCFLFYVQVKDYPNILKLRWWPFAFTSSRTIEKQKEVWNYSPCLILCLILEEKHFSIYALLCYKDTIQLFVEKCQFFIQNNPWLNNIIYH